MIQPRRYRRQPNAAGNNSTDLSALKAQLDQSSGINRALGLVFVSVLMYVGITLASVTDLMLLLPDTPVKLPLLSIDIPLFAFFAITPLIVLGLHLNILLNLLEHSKKLYRWIENTPGTTIEKQTESHPFLFNLLAFINDSSGHLQSPFPGILVQSVLFYSPPLLFVVFQVRFSDYHHLPMSLWHMTLVLLDLTILTILRSKILDSENYTENGHSIIRWAHLTIFKRPLYLLFIFGNFVYSIDNIYLLNIVMKPQKSNEITRLFESMNSFRHKPRIVVHDRRLVEGSTDPHYVTYSMSHYGIDVYDALDTLDMIFGKGIDLQGRHLNHADLSGCILDGADLRGAQLNRADLSKTSLRNSNMQKARLRDAKLSYAHLQRANLTGAKMAGIELNHAVLTGANLKNVQADHAQMKGALLTGVNFCKANLKNAQMQRSIFVGARFDSAKLRMSNLEKADLRFTILNHADLRSSKLSQSQMQGSDMTFTMLQGIYADSAFFQNSRLCGTQIDGGIFIGAHMKNADIWTKYDEVIWLDPDTNLTFSSTEAEKTANSIDNKYLCSSTSHFKIFNSRVQDSRSQVSSIEVPSERIPTPNTFTRIRMELLTLDTIPLHELLLDTTLKLSSVFITSHNDIMCRHAQKRYLSKWSTFAYDYSNSDLFPLSQHTKDSLRLQYYDSLERINHVYFLSGNDVKH